MYVEDFKYTTFVLMDHVNKVIVVDTMCDRRQSYYKWNKCQLLNCTSRVL